MKNRREIVLGDGAELALEFGLTLTGDGFPSPLSLSLSLSSLTRVLNELFEAVFLQTIECFGLTTFRKLCFH